MKRTLAIALSAFVLSAGAPLAVSPSAAAADDAASIGAYRLETLSETDIDAVAGRARRIVCSGDILMAQHHFLAGNPGEGVIWLLVAFLRPAICS